MSQSQIVTVRFAPRAQDMLTNIARTSLPFISPNASVVQISLKDLQIFLSVFRLPSLSSSRAPHASERNSPPADHLSASPQSGKALPKRQPRTDNPFVDGRLQPCASRRDVPKVRAQIAAGSPSRGPRNHNALNPSSEARARRGTTRERALIAL
jgi:hypothetical protein